MLAEMVHVVEHVDTDADGVMHFTRYQSLFETVALRGLESCGVGPRRWASTGHVWAMAEVRVRYRAPAHYMERTAISVDVDRVSAARLFLSARVRDADGSELASGTLTMCLIDCAGNPVPLPNNCLASVGPKTTEGARETA